MAETGRLMGKKKIEACSCDEVQHMRTALQMIAYLAGEKTEGTVVDDLAQINNLAHQALDLKKLEGDPGVYKLPAVVVRAGQKPK